MTLGDPIDSAVRVLCRAVDTRAEPVQDSASRMLAQGYISAVATFCALAQSQVAELVDLAAASEAPAGYLRRRLEELTS